MPPVPTPGPEVLRWLRRWPSYALNKWGFVTQVDAATVSVGGRCTLTCEQIRNSNVYMVTRTLTPNGTDWYIPYQGRRALYCDVPNGQPEGTLVVTFPMNGCALEVHELPGGGNRFFHDADGKHMHTDAAAASVGPRISRIIYEYMAGPSELAKNQMLSIKEHKRGRLHFEHNIYSVMNSRHWSVCASAVVVRDREFIHVHTDVPFILDRISG